MTRTTYDQPASERAEQLIADVFALGKIGYVALGSGQEVLLRHAPGMQSETTAETNFYEELLVNPTLLKLASQRGELDCGGLKYIAIGYGGFTQLILLSADGHISVGVSRNAPVREIATQVDAILQRHGLAWSPPKAWLLK